MSNEGVHCNNNGNAFSGPQGLLCDSCENSTDDHHSTNERYPAVKLRWTSFGHKYYERETCCELNCLHFGDK